MYKELLALLPRYAWKTMAEIPGRKLLSRHLASAYKDVAERTLEVKNPRIAKGKGRSNREWDGAALKVGIAILSTQLASEAIRVLGPRQRRMSVALETKVDKSCGAAKPRSRVLDVSHDENGVLCRQRPSRGYITLIAPHSSKLTAPLQIAASWTVPRPATHMWVLVEKGAARQWVNPSTWSSPGCWRQYHQGNAIASVSKSGLLQAPGHNQKKTGACYRSCSYSSLWVLKEVLRFWRREPLAGLFLPVLLAQDHRRGQ